MTSERQNKDKVTKYNDPCADAAKKSFECLEDNYYQKDNCREAFENYRNCKAFWLKARREGKA
ncbi:hypothetical protein E3Q22_00976 [Wallemia mellicola]|uniref:CHCH domain-containing protein n=1 Tax=Wallemia mellicola TaxID=1708541 RepID=A0A4T0RQ38_9BASI|nr:hypothetical protein E3Q24_00744 [Wallemia mellicola]TIB78846.1 hypothetical protein E3Q23_00658 [Wallemia mellicola]TIB81507.1 hypothetical protein E3Q22_00976 [Wallemia mellicola]TIB90473.1 hypothetical protein E3Q21_00277 [Wallemia mellicola]TIB92188.1 hypothetical protein E3Q20_00403 [Wallemia mellicola]